MSQFVCFEAAEDNDDVTLENESCERETMSDIDIDFIDDIEQNENVENYYAFENVSRDYDDGIGDSLAGFDFSQEPSNYCSDWSVMKWLTSKTLKKRLRSLIKLW